MRKTWIRPRIANWIVFNNKLAFCLWKFMFCPCILLKIPGLILYAHYIISRFKIDKSTYLSEFNRGILSNYCKYWIFIKCASFIKFWGRAATLKKFNSTVKIHSFQTNSLDWLVTTHWGIPAFSNYLIKCIENLSLRT